ncbi:MAG: phage scaffolding protein [Thermoplasmata archaeon]|nr:phage scaffolding protein [Thermoplasmata archaeon]
MDLKEIVGEELAGKLSASQDELVKQVIAKLSTAELMVGNSKTLIPLHVFNEKNDALKASKDLVKKFEDDLKVLKDASAGNTTLQTQISELQRANKAAKDEYELSQIKNKKALAVQLALVSAGVNDEKARNLLSREFDTEKIELTETGEVKGIVDLLKPIKDNPSFKSMFGTIKIVGQEHQEAGAPEGAFFTREEVKNHEGDRSWMDSNFTKVQKSMASWKK